MPALIHGPSPLGDNWVPRKRGPVSMAVPGPAKPAQNVTREDKMLERLKKLTVRKHALHVQTNKSVEKGACSTEPENQPPRVHALRPKYRKPPPQPLSQSLHTLKLNPIDHTIDRGYVRIHLGFPFDGDQYKMNEAVQHIRDVQTIVLKRWPFLAGVIFPLKATEKDVLEVKYHYPVMATDANKWLKVWHISRRMCTYGQLLRWGAPPGWFARDPSRREYAVDPAMYTHVSFFQSGGGMVLSFAFHHAVMDGASIKLFLQVFAAACRPGMKLWSTNVLDGAHDDRLSELRFLQPTPERFGFDHDPIDFCKEYRLAPPPRQDGPSPCTTLVFEFKHSMITKLKSEVIHAAVKERGYLGWLSSTDCLCGLIWVAILRARASRLNLDEDNTRRGLSFSNLSMEDKIRKDVLGQGPQVRREAKSPAEWVRFTTAVDARRRVSRPLPEYMGNLVVAAVAESTLARIIGVRELDNLRGRGKPHDRLWTRKWHEITGIRNDISVHSIANAALAIREAIKKVDDDYVRRRMAIVGDAAAKIRETNAYANAADSANMGIDFSSWKDWMEHGYDAEGKMKFWEPHKAAKGKIQTQDPPKDARGKIKTQGKMETQDPPKPDPGGMEFHIPGVKATTPDFFRTGPQREGSIVLLPRLTCGPTGEHAPWQVSLCLRNEDMRHVRSQTELGAYVHKVHDREYAGIYRINGGDELFQKFMREMEEQGGCNGEGYPPRVVLDDEDGEVGGDVRPAAPELKRPGTPSGSGGQNGGNAPVQKRQKVADDPSKSVSGESESAPVIYLDNAEFGEPMDES